MRLLSFVLVCCAAGFLFCPAAEAANPRFNRTEPIGGQRGTEVDVILKGDRLDDAEELLLYDSGMEVTHFEVIQEEERKKRGDRIKVRLKIDPQCRLGTQRMRVRTKTGMSELVNFHVGAFPIVEEVEPNTEFSSPQVIPNNSSVAGKITPEDVDYYQIEAKKGERISAEIFGMRFGMSDGTNYFDPYLAILNSDRFELAVSDDSPLVWNDAVVSIIAPEDGKYYLQVRDASYNGDNNAHYLLHVGNFPRPVAVLPAGGRPGQTLDVTFLGDVSGTVTRQVTLPAEIPEDGFGLDLQDDHGITPSRLPFLLSDIDNFIEQEPNNDLATATAGSVPGAFNGVISEKGDQDFFKFTAQKDQEFQFEVYARRIRSGLDPVLTIFRIRDGARLASDDDARRPDSALKFKFPEDGEYALMVNDHLGNGSPTYTYRVEVTLPQPRLHAEPTEFARYVQSQIVIPQGGGIGIVANVQRGDFGGPVNFRSEDLPPGVRMECPANWREDGSATVVFYADETAPLGGKFSKIEAFLDDPKQPDRKISGPLRQDVLMIRARNNDRVWEERMNRMPVVVIEKAPFKCWIETPAVPVVKNGNMNLKIRCEKAEGWDEEIRLVMLQNPPGVTSNGSVVIAKGANEADMAVNASDGAAVRENMIAVRCMAKYAGGDYEYVTPLVPLRVEDRYINFEFAQGAVEQGKETPYLIKVTKNKDFEGEAIAELVGLPANATAEKMKLTKDTAEFMFTIKAAEDTPPGMSQNVQCRVEVPENGTVVLHNLGNGRLRVDKPAPPPKNPEPTPPMPTPMPEAPVAQAEAPPKPLSRLEQLRLKQQQKAAGQ
ncbi:PPC domain-containing protein [Planctomicrobium sp. SH661]|uniref:PPC domain-containing protein n=1 Tax=Planctomicrobium sp. SH661 TaxID=3448124 RepID=UPI003F5B91EB